MKTNRILFLMLVLAGPICMTAATCVGASLVSELGSSSGNARLVLVVVFGFGAAWSMRLSYLADQGRRSFFYVLKEANELATHGCSVAEAVDAVERVTNDACEGLRGRVSESANIQVLLGMLFTAFWLASQAPQFEHAASALTTSGTGTMAGIVAGLLQLGPKAFVSTAAAVASALILMLIGGMQSSTLETLRPTRKEIVDIWSSGSSTHRINEINAQQAREEQLVARVVSASQVQLLQETFVEAAAQVHEMQAELGTTMKDMVHSMKGVIGNISSMVNLMASASQSAKTFNETATLMAVANGRLSEITNSLNAAGIHVGCVNAGLEHLTKQVESYGDKLVLTTSEFRENFIRETVQLIPGVVSTVTRETVDCLKPHFNSIASDVHKGIEDSARSIQEQYSTAFSDSLVKAQGNLESVAKLASEIDDSIRRLDGQFSQSSTSWSTSAVGLKTSMDTIATSFATAAGQGHGAAEATEKARTALLQTATTCHRAAESLASLVQKVNSELTSVRRDAELLGQIREAVRPANPTGRA